MQKIVWRIVRASGWVCFLGFVMCAQGQDSFWAHWQARATATQNAQPHWITPLVLVTPRLEQEFRTDFVHQYNTKGFEQWTYDNGKGLELIPERHRDSGEPAAVC